MSLVDINAKYRHLIEELTYRNQSVGISGVYRDILESLLAFLNDNSIIINGEGKQVKVLAVHGNAERTIAKLKAETNIILPLISVSREDTNEADDRRRFDSILVHEKVWDTKTQRATRIISTPPRPITIVYKINFWTKFVNDMDQLLEITRSRFKPALNVLTPFSDSNKAFIIDEDSASDFTVGDGADRRIVKSLVIEVETYIPSPKFLITSTGKITEFNTEIDIIDDC